MQSNLWMDTGKDIVCVVQTYAQKVYKPEKIDKPQFLLKERSTERNIKDGL